MQIIRSLFCTYANEIKQKNKRVKRKFKKMSNFMKAVLFKRPGSAEQLFIDIVAKPIAKKNEILIKVKSAGVNRIDILQRQGKYRLLPDELRTLGVEVSGLVAESQNERFPVGKRVMALTNGGGYAEYVNVHHSLCMYIPENLSFSQAACIPECWITAYKLLHAIAGIKECDNVLIHAGASGVGTAAIQLCKIAKANSIIITAGSDAKIAKCIELGATHGINYKLDGKFSQKVLNATKDKGVDILLDCVGASHFEENLKCCSMDCRWMLYGLLGGTNVSKISLHHLLDKRVQLISSVLRNRSLSYKGRLISDFSAQILPHFESGIFKVICDSIFKLEEVQKSHFRIEENKNFGKIVLENS